MRTLKLIISSTLVLWLLQCHVGDSFVPVQPPPSPQTSSVSLDARCPSPGMILRMVSSSSADVTPALVKELREMTGAGMMDCKKALIVSDGDMEKANEYLRTKGLAKADKKSTRVAAEGRIAFAAAAAGEAALSDVNQDKNDRNNKAVLVEINCETDFVAKDTNFLEFCQKVADAALSLTDEHDVQSLWMTPIPTSEDQPTTDASTVGTTSTRAATVEEMRQALVAKLGENIQVRRMALRGGNDATTNNNVVVGAYVHMNRIGVLVELEGEGATSALCTNVAMHVAAMNPPYATFDDVPAHVLDKERQILAAQALESGKPKEIVDKMVEGRIRKYLQEICCVSQPYVKDDSKTVEQFLKEQQAKLIGFTRLAVGEGIEKNKSEGDFAQEVAKMAAGTLKTL